MRGQTIMPSDTQRRSLQTAVAGALCVLLSVAHREATSAAEPAGPYGLLVPGQFLHIPGPNPILVPGPLGAWDDGVIEAADAFRDDQTYCLYYHGTGQGKSYRLGVATASHPLGPFQKHGDRPILDLGSPGSWDDRNVPCAMVLNEAPGKYLMWYSATGNSPSQAKWSIGLATASHPLGPWKSARLIDPPHRVAIVVIRARLGC